LTEQLGLQREDVIQDAIDAPAFEAVFGDHTSTLEMAAQRRSERSVDARLSPHLGLFEHMEAPIER